MARDERGERELGPKLGCNYSRLPCKLSSCHSYLTPLDSAALTVSKLLLLPSAS